MGKRSAKAVALIDVEREIVVTRKVLALACVAFGALAFAAAPASQPQTVHLVVHVADVRNQNGQLIFGVFAQPDAFPNIQSKSVNWQVKPASGDGVFTCDLSPGVYAASVLHDENGNGDMDRNFAGVPTEGYGVTNNPKPKYRQATFKEATFTLPAGGAELTISIQYKYY
ncbi:MAG TPA: DUF2141 domain-containing protein [Tepidisphaeraceae bacterium]|nr:DUF2141 domain-containing protein [Tepidisphaeraceae bacterium]